MRFALTGQRWSGEKSTASGDPMIRDDIKAATIAAMKGGDKETTATLRMVSAAVKNRDIEVRAGAAPANDDQLVTEVLQKMVKQRRESADIYRNNGRDDRARVEEAEIAVIERFLPRQLSDAEAEAQIRAIVAETGASSMKDMGRVMALVKERLGGSIEPARASALVKATLS
jgi:uncharacterized protein YqeY